MEKSKTSIIWNTSDRRSNLSKIWHLWVGHMLLLNINRKVYMESPMTLSHLTLSDLKGSNSRLLGFRSLIFCEGAELGHKLLLNINRKAYMESPMTL